MKTRLLGLVGILVLILGVWYVARPTGFVPMFDANLVRIAMTAHEAQCAGIAFMSGESPLVAAECRESSGFSQEINLNIVQIQFCQTVAEAFNMTPEACMKILTDFQLWPTYDGSLTDQWSESNPYPGGILGTDTEAEDSSRTGGREGLQRGEQ